MYDPTIGRFISEDPIGFADDINPIRYVKNSPTNATDPTGLYGIQFHFYTVYTVLRARGWEHDVSYRVAGWSQYVDDDAATIPYAGVGNAMTGRNGGSNYRNTALMRQFHFWGSDATTATVRNPDDLHELLVNQVSEFNHAPNQLTDLQRRAEARLGVLLHTFADSYAHEGFTAWHNNEINTRTGSSRPNRGHADAAEGGNAPDNCYNDLDRSLAAAKVLYSLFPRGSGKHVPWHVLERELRGTLGAVPANVRGDNWNEERSIAAQVAASRQLIQRLFRSDVQYNSADFAVQRAHYLAEMREELQRVGANMEQ